MANSTRQIICNIVGAILIFFHNGPYYYWGNMAIYVTSYALRQKTASSSTPPDDVIRPALALTIYDPFWMGTMYLVGYLASRSTSAPIRLLIAIGILLINTSFVSLNLLMDLISLELLFMVYGLFIGLGTGFYEGILLQNYVVNQSLRHTALLTTSVMAGSAAGGTLMVIFVTWYTNPNNLSPDLAINGVEVFTQKEVLDRVPNMLLALAGIVSILQLFGLCLLRNNRIRRRQRKPNVDDHFPIDTRQSAVSGSKTNARLDGVKRIKEPSICHESFSDFESSLLRPSAVRTKTYLPRELVKSKEFYLLSTLYFLAMTARVVVSIYYKLYGQIWVNDDHFLTQLGFIQAICSIPSSVFWGIVMDRTSLKTSFVILFTLLTVSLVAMFISAQYNRWAYFAATIVASISSNVNACFNVATVKSFGRKHFAMNVTLVEISATLSAVISSVLIDSMIPICGHAFEFLYGSGLCTIGLIGVVWLMADR